MAEIALRRLPALLAAGALVLAVASSCDGKEPPSWYFPPRPFAVAVR